MIPGVDSLGDLTLMEYQSPERISFLLIDSNTDSIFVAIATGSILHQYKRIGEARKHNWTSLRGAKIQ